MKPICLGTHALIASGSCPWCKAPIREGKTVEEQPTHERELQWNTAALLHAATKGDYDDAVSALTNMLGSSVSLNVALPILRAGLFRSEADVSAFAQDGLLQFGDGLTSDQVHEYQRQLKDAGKDDQLALRLLLLGAFLRRRHTNAQWREPRGENILWLIDNHPRAYVLSTPYCHLSAREETDAFAVAKQKWLNVAESNPHDLSILDNAASFFRSSDPSYSELLYQKAKALEPDNPKWSEKLAQVSTIMGIHKTGAERVAQSRKALAEYQNALVTTLDRSHRLYLLCNTAKAALDAENLDAAELAVAEYAALTQKPEYSRIEDTGHELSLLQGRCALRRGDIDTARGLLLKAAEYPCGPGFGPNLRLARELLERGERSAVIEYLRQCSKSWDSSSERIAEWTRLIEEGMMPDFGANLEY